MLKARVVVQRLVLGVIAFNLISANVRAQQRSNSEQRRIWGDNNIQISIDMQRTAERAAREAEAMRQKERQQAEQRAADARIKAEQTRLLERRERDRRDAELEATRQRNEERRKREQENRDQRTAAARQERLRQQQESPVASSSTERRVKTTSTNPIGGTQGKPQGAQTRINGERDGIVFPKFTPNSQQGPFLNEQNWFSEQQRLNEQLMRNEQSRRHQQGMLQQPVPQGSTDLPSQPDSVETQDPTGTNTDQPLDRSDGVLSVTPPLSYFADRSLEEANASTPPVKLPVLDADSYFSSGEAASSHKPPLILCRWLARGSKCIYSAGEVANAGNGFLLRFWRISASGHFNSAARL